MNLKTLLGVGIMGLLSFTACNDDYPALEAPQSTESKIETIIPTRSGDRSVVTKTNLDNIIAKMRGRAKTRSAYPQNYTIQTINGESGKPAVYVVNFENNGGFILISASKRYNPILAYSETGHFNLEHNIGELKEWENTVISKIEENETLPLDSVRQYLAQWGEYEPKALPVATSPYGSLPREEFLKLQAVVQDSVMAWTSKGYEVFGINDCPYLDAAQRAELQEAIIGGMFPLYTEYWNEFTRIVKKQNVNRSNIENFVYSTWGQEAGYNQFFPILGNGERAYAGCGPVAAGQIMYYFKHPNTYNWGAMKQNVSTAESARLLFDIAEMSDANYDIKGTGTTITDIKKTFEDLGYSLQHKEDNNFLNTIMENCDQRKPVYARGESDSEGHAWVISGYHMDDVETFYEVWTFMRYNAFTLYDKVFYDRIVYYNLYINWGWDGDYNGYYNTPKEYINNRAYLYNITPNR